MDSDPQPWDEIYRREGRVFDEPFPGFEKLVSQFQTYGCSTILDLGCGSGRHTIHLAKAGFEVTGMDNSMTALKMTANGLSVETLKASIILADMREPLPFDTGSFTGLISTQVIHHALRSRVLQTIREIGRVIASGGIAFVSVAATIDEEDDMVEIEPGTFVPRAGWEKGLPHHIFSPKGFAAEFHDFDVLDLSLLAENRVLAILAKKR